MSTEDVLREHRKAGRFFRAGGVRSFVRSAGEGEPVFCVHGVPASSFLYRKLLAELRRRDLRGMAVDLPGLGLADRPEEFDYSWSGLGTFLVEATRELQLDRFHLVVHDIGGPLGFEVLAERSEAVQSVTILNTMIEVDQFRPPWVMRPFTYPYLGEAWLGSMVKPLFRRLFYWIGVKDSTAISPEEIDAYVDLLKREDNGRAFLKIMRGFECTEAKRERYVSALRSFDGPRQVIWGKDDPALPLEEYGDQARRAADVAGVQALPGRHFVPEEQAPALAKAIGELVHVG